MMSSREIPNPGFTKDWTVSSPEYFISTTGNDSGTGSETNPWKTISRALEDSTKMRLDPNNSISMILSAGIHDAQDPIALSDSRRIPISITGAAPIDVSVESIVSVSAGLGFQSIVLQLDDVSGISIDHLIDLRDGTSDFKNTMDGVWKIVAVDTLLDRITIQYTGSNEIVVGPFTASGQVYTTIIRFGSKHHGVLLHNRTSSVSLANIGIVSSDTTDSALDMGAGILMTGASTTLVLNHVVVVGFDTGIRVSNQGVITASSVSVSGSTVSGISIEDASQFQSTNALIANGNRKYGIQILDGSRLVSETSIIACNNTLTGLVIDGCSTMNSELLACNSNGESGMRATGNSILLLGAFGMFDGNTNEGVRIESGSVFLSVDGANINANLNGITGIFVVINASMTGFDVLEVMENGETGIYVHLSSLLEVQEIVASGNGLVGVVSRLGSCITCGSALFDTHEEYGLLARESAVVVLGATEARSTGEVVVVPPSQASSGTIGSGGSTIGGSGSSGSGAGGIDTGDPGDDGDDGDGDDGGGLPDYNGGGTGIAARYSSLVVLTGASLVTDNDVGVLSDENSYVDIASSGSDHPTVSENEFGVRAQTRGRTRISSDVILSPTNIVNLSPLANTKDNIIGFNQQ